MFDNTADYALVLYCEERRVQLRYRLVFQIEPSKFSTITNKIGASEPACESFRRDGQQHTRRVTFGGEMDCSAGTYPPRQALCGKKRSLAEVTNACADDQAKVACTTCGRPLKAGICAVCTARVRHTNDDNDDDIDNDTVCRPSQRQRSFDSPKQGLLSTPWIIPLDLGGEPQSRTQHTQTEPFVTVNDILGRTIEPSAGGWESGGYRTRYTQTQPFTTVGDIVGPTIEPSADGWKSGRAVRYRVGMLGEHGVGVSEPSWRHIKRLDIPLYEPERTLRKFVLKPAKNETIKTTRAARMRRCGCTIS